MAFTLISTIKRFVGLSTDAKPTDVPVGSTYFEYDTGDLYITYDGTNWAPKPNDEWSPSQVSDVPANDSNKTFTVPAGKEWQVLSIMAGLASSGTAGNRQMAVLITDGDDNVLARVYAQVTQAASLTKYYRFGINAPTETAFYGSDPLAVIQMTLPLLVLPAGYKVNVLDSAAVDAAADDMTVRMMVLERSV